MPGFRLKCRLALFGFVFKKEDLGDRYWVIRDSPFRKSWSDSQSSEENVIGDVVSERALLNPESSYRGSFNVRIPVSLHRKARQAALALGVSLNKFIQKVEDELVTLDKV